MIKLTTILAEMRVNEPNALYVRVTNNSYTDVDADIIIKLIYYDTEMSGGRSDEYNDTLQDVVSELKKDINNLAGGYYDFKDLYRFMKGPISDIFEDTLTKNDVLTLVDYYNNNDNQGILKYILDANNSTDYWQSQEELPYIEGDYIIEPDKEELISLKEIKDDIEDVLLPFVTLYNQLGTNKFTIAYGDYVGEGYLVEGHTDGISYKEPLWDKDFSRTLSEFNNKGFLTVSYKDYKENPEVF